MFRVIVFLCALHAYCIQGVHIYASDAGIEYLSPEYFDVEKCTLDVVPVNDTFNTLSYILAIIKDFPETVIIRLSLWQYALGEYVVPGGFDFSMSFCDAFNEPTLTAGLFESIGFTGEQCPPLSGTYGFSSYTLPADLFPDGLPAEKYMVRFELHIKMEKIYSAEIFINIIQ